MGMVLGWVVTGCPKSLPWPLQLTGILWGPERGELLAGIWATVRSWWLADRTNRAVCLGKEGSRE